MSLEGEARRRFDPLSLHATRPLVQTAKLVKRVSVQRSLIPSIHQN